VERGARPPAAGAPDPARAFEAAASADGVVLVTIDGVRWQEIFRGVDPGMASSAALPRGARLSARELTPNLHRLFFDEGVVLGDPATGERFLASGPRFVSLPGYLELMTGSVTGCEDNECRPSLPWILPRQIARSADAAPGSAAVFASWGRVARAVQPGGGVVLTAGRDPSDEAPPFPGSGDYRPDQRTAALAIHYLVTHRPRFLWVALGDTDEWAHRHDYRGYLDALRFADAFVGELAAHLDEMGTSGARTTLLVTTDHGRDGGFADHGGIDSATVWLMARGGPVGRGGVRPLAEDRHLRDVAPTIAALLGEPTPQCARCGEPLAELL
jgi:hypothetical protein